MSFGKLLAAGKSLIGGKDMARYQVNPRVSLPRFISPKNPFIQQPVSETNAQAVPEKVAPSPLKQDLEAKVPAAATNVAAKSAVRSSARNWSVEQAQKFNPLKRFGLRARKTVSVIPRFDQKQMQGELSLERVRVIRNDLSETDFEVVPAGTAGNTKRMSPDESAWGRLAARIFGSETT